MKIMFVPTRMMLTSFGWRRSTGKGLESRVRRIVARTGRRANRCAPQITRVGFARCRHARSPGATIATVPNSAAKEREGRVGADEVMESHSTYLAI